MKAKISLSGTLAGLALSLVIAGALPRTYSAQIRSLSLLMTS
ncbi:MAG TPA: hypothetical protein VKM94_05845 [Blastocatellia bacterium]|nr:hypothetical protein [Blastocatellia bacterium]